LLIIDTDSTDSSLLMLKTIYQSTRPNIPEGLSLHRCENLKFPTIIMVVEEYKLQYKTLFTIILLVPPS
jgi:hypothetical protein